MGFSLARVCCGSSSESLKPTSFVSVDSNGSNSTRTRGPTAREKALLNLQLKRSERKSIFSCELDVACTWTPPVFQKSSSEEVFLRETMKSHMFFEELSNVELTTLIAATEKVELRKDKKCIHQDETLDYLYIVEEGELNMFCEIGKKCHGTIGKGQVYGELALLWGQTCTVSLIANEFTVAWRLQQSVFRNVLARRARERDVGIVQSLRNVKLFESVDERVLQKMSEAFTRVSFRAGEIIVRKGDLADTFYIVESGSVKVHDVGIGDSMSSELPLAEGESFGEQSLLSGEPHFASISALTDVTTLVVGRSTFDENIGELQGILDSKARQQRLRGLPIFANSDVSDIEFERLAECMKDVCYLKGTKLARIGKPYPRNLWFIRKGQLIVFGTNSSKVFNLLAGDYFGEKSVLIDTEHISSHEAICEEQLTSWVLTQEDIEAVIGDMNRLGKAGIYEKSKQQERSVYGLDDVRRHYVLGQGGFGKVWLVEAKSDGKPYAMKVLSKRKLLDSKQERSVIREKELLGLLRHPFILNLISAFQDTANLYLVLPLIQGGELFNIVASETKYGRGLPNHSCAFYAAAIITALGHFHHRHIAYRDLKLENILIDNEGYPKIVDLGFSRIILDKSYTFCGTPEYLAPEIIMAKGHNHAVDYWSFGVLIYEMLVGRSPFSRPRQTQMDMFKRIVLVNYECPSNLLEEAQDLIKKLLTRSVLKRIGAQSRGHRDIMNHHWFKKSDICFKNLSKKALEAPWIPTVKDLFDASKDYDQQTDEKEMTNSSQRFTPEEQLIFKEF